MYLPRTVMESRGLKAEKENIYRSSFQPPISRQSNPSVGQMLRNFEKIPDECLISGVLEEHIKIITFSAVCYMKTTQKNLLKTRLYTCTLDVKDINLREN